MTDFQYPVIDPERTGQQIKKRIIEKKMTVEQVREQIQIGTVQSVYKWLNGKSCPRIDNFVALSRLLDTTIDSLIVCKGDKTAS